jgi:hypothetical protein
MSIKGSTAMDLSLTEAGAGSNGSVAALTEGDAADTGVAAESCSPWDAE